VAFLWRLQIVTDRVPLERVAASLSGAYSVSPVWLVIPSPSLVQRQCRAPGVVALPAAP